MAKDIDSFVKLGDVAQKVVQKFAAAKRATVQVDLTQRQITLLRVALLIRLRRLKSLLEDSNQAELRASYDESAALLHMLHHLRLGMRDMAIEEIELEKRHGQDHTRTT